MAVLKFKSSDNKALTVNARTESTVLMQGNSLAYTFDYGGRLVGAFRDGRNYRRSFANQILEKQTGPNPGLSGRLRRTLSPDEVKTLEVEAYDFAGAVSAELRQLEPAAEEAMLETVRRALAHINNYCYTGLQRERELYERLYHPVTILPPDQYLALYLQMTEGCSFNRCSFCGFYRDRRFHIKPPEVFHEHIRRVRAFFGESLRLRHSLFIGDANALILPQKRLLPRFEIMNQEFELMPRGLSREARQAWRAAHPVHFEGIYSFIDAFATRTKRAADFAALAALGLRRVYVGLESGDAALLRFLGKPNTPDDVVRLVNECKEGGVAVGLIALVGAGGARFDKTHVQATTQLINSLPLDENDLIYLSELVDTPDSAYSRLAVKAGIEPYGIQEVERQMLALRAGFRFNNREHAPRVSSYDIREFVY
jgi:hypothetical protein